MSSLFAEAQQMAGTQLKKLQPLVYHRTVKLSALAISVSVAAGAELGGVVGALLGIPAAGALKVVFGELADWRRERAAA